MESMEAGGDPVAQKLLAALVQFRRLHWRHSPMAGLTGSEIMVLFCIKGAATRDGSGIRVSEISGLLRVASPTITQQLNNLETHGFVEKQSDPQDGRAVRIRLTAQGEAALKTASDAFLASIKGLVAYLGADDSNELAELLARVSTYFQERKELMHATTGHEQ
ncbi:MAG TPA: MarR family transcriptional regulator [Chloroflexia bacterium]|nr:MarR family transcriptional regulator [Chloroflexia bacterium]